MSSTASPEDLIRNAVDRFYRLVLTDRRLGPRFAGIDVRRLKSELSSVLVGALHTPRRARPAELIAAYHGLSLTGDDYDLLGHYLLSTLLPLRLGTDLLVRVGSILTETRADVVGNAEPRRAAPRRGPVPPTIRSPIAHRPFGRPAGMKLRAQFLGWAPHGLGKL